MCQYQPKSLLLCVPICVGKSAGLVGNVPSSVKKNTADISFAESRERFQSILMVSESKGRTEQKQPEERGGEGVSISGR